MDDAMERAEDTLTRFIKSSVKLLRPFEVEQKRVELMVRELLTVRPYSTSGQLTVRRVYEQRRDKNKRRRQETKQQPSTRTVHVPT